MPKSLQDWWNALSTVDQLVLIRGWDRNPVPYGAVQVLQRSGLQAAGGQWQLREERGRLYWHPKLQRFLGERAGFIDEMQRRRGTA